MKKKVKFSKRLHYEFDKFFSRGPSVIIAGLAIGSLLVILLWTLLLVVTRLAPGDDPPMNLIEAFWFSLLGTMGSGSIGGRDSDWGYRILSFAIALSSIFLISNFIGLVANAIQSKLADLRKGKSEVVESGHIVLLGWSSQIFTLIKEIISANLDKPKSTLVILGQEDKSRMEDEIRQKISTTGTTTILCRTGNPMDMTDLKLASIESARSIIITPPSGRLADVEVIKTVLAITKDPNRRFEPHHIVAGIRFPQNRQVTEILGRGEVEWVYISDVISRIIAQTSRQSGLSVIYSDLLDFEKNEIYFFDPGSLTGSPFRTALYAYENCAVIGLVDRVNGPRLNPPMDTVINPGDQIIVISGDDIQSFCEPDLKSLVDSGMVLPHIPEITKKENILMLGWNWNSVNILKQLDHYAAPESRVHVVANTKEVKQNIERLETGLKNIKIQFEFGEIYDRDTLLDLKLANFDHIILLSYSDQLPVQEADSLTLLALLQLRNIAETYGYRYSIVSEILDVKNSRLAETTRADDFIVSDRLISLMMAQVEENKRINSVFQDLFSAEGSEIYLKPAGSYVKTGIPINFYTVIESAARRNEAAIGYRITEQAGSPEKNFGVVLNPNKAEKVAFNDQDRIIVLAEK